MRTTLLLSEAVFFAERLKTVPDPLGDRGKWVLIEHARDPLSVRRAQKESRPSEIRIGSTAVKDFEQQRHFLCWYPPRQLLEFRPVDQEACSSRAIPGLGIGARLTG
jgi:hypothetical protein